MTVPQGRLRKPRIRKSAPTVREMAEKAQAEAAIPKRQRRLNVWRATKWPFARIARADNKLTGVLAKVFRPVRKVLGWLVPRYFVNSWRELRLVTWPGRRETWRLTGAVFVFAIVFGVMITGVDKVIDKFFKELVIK